MMKNVTQFKSIIQGIESNFHFDQGCPLTTAKEALFECLKWIGQIEDQAKAQAEAKVEEQKKLEENVEVKQNPES